MPMNRRAFLGRLAASLSAARMARRSAAAQAAPPADSDPYAIYIRTSRDFRRVKQDTDWCRAAWPGWIYMPWTYQWDIGYTGSSGAWSRQNGCNGAFLDGNSGRPDSPAGKLAWIDRFGLRFYVDHTARKGYLHLWDGGQKQAHAAQLHGTDLRPKPLNDALLEQLKAFVRENVEQVKGSPNRAAYALDDEASWGYFVHPTMWRVTDDPAAYGRWLREVYGVDAPQRSGWISYEDLRPKLDKRAVRDFDAGPLMDQWTFNDSVWCNLLGDLVEYANSIDPQTPCGIVGAQAPSAFGGYDYARLMRKLQFIEAYNIGSSQAVIRSFNPRNAIPAVTTHFHQSSADDVWQVWYYLAHGNRGHIGWVENWFAGEKPQSWHADVAPHYHEAAEKIGPLLADAVWAHDGVAIYYSHPSIQLGWILDAQAHGRTWVNRESDHRLGSSHLVRKAWENMLRDSGLQYNFVSYIDTIRQGVPDEYRVLILPACLCLSDTEARAIEAFCRRGGTVIADYLPGVWDQHGRGRKAGGVLDHLFGVRHDPGMTAHDVFGGRLWAETDQDAHYDYKTYDELLSGSGCLMDASGFHKAVRAMGVGHANRFGQGAAILMNLSPQWYNAYRVSGAQTAQRRSVFVQPIEMAGVRRRAWLEGAGEREFGHEITCWRKADGRTVLFLCTNPEVEATETGGGSAVRLRTDALDVTLRLARPARNVRDERQARNLSDGDRFGLRWVRNEAVVLSFETMA